jgi:nucleotide-binding universal stress UspA family protein
MGVQGRASGLTGVDRILVVVDGSDQSDTALRYAIELCELTKATLTALAIERPLRAGAITVRPADEAKLDRESQLEASAANARAQAGAAGIDFEIDVRAGLVAAELIVRAAREGDFDLVIGQKGFPSEYGTTSTRNRVLDHAPGPVLVVK